MTETVDPRYEAIYRAVHAIPEGRVVSYGQIAARAGLPGRARLVGRALRESPDNLELPWHRVLRANGTLAFVTGSPAWVAQCRRLQAAGVVVHNGRVSVTDYGLDHDLDRHLWGEPGS